MAKSDHPPLHMILEGGRLAPASAYEQERLASFPEGTPFTVRIASDRGNRTIRRWWLVLGLAVRQCKTPWKTAEQASEAIKLAIGVVKQTTTPWGGQIIMYPRSLAELEEPELDEAFRMMVAVLARVTGVDPLTLQKEAETDGRHEVH